MRKAVKAMAGGVAVGTGVVMLRPGTHANRLATDWIGDASRHLRYLSGRLQGLQYRVRGRHPDPDVDDGILADRIRSELGGLEKRLDLPHVHVMVERHVALLHGDVPTQADADAVERAVASVSGVTAVNSHLHVGLIGGDTRPSEGRAHQEKHGAGT